MEKNKKITGFILVAGLGSRLAPITNEKPKALVKVNGRTLLENAIGTLKSFDINDIVINIHHYADMVLDYLESNANFGVNITVSDERECLLDTGGAIKKAIPYFADSKAILIYNVDIISSINISEMLDYHNDSEAMATLAVRNRQTSRYLEFNKDNRLMDRIKNETSLSTEKWLQSMREQGRFPWAFSGIHIISPSLFELMPDEDIFSIIDLYIESTKKHPISAYIHNKDTWLDCGRYKEMLKLGYTIR